MELNPTMRMMMTKINPKESFKNFDPTEIIERYKSIIKDAEIVEEKIKQPYVNNDNEVVYDR